MRFAPVLFILPAAYATFDWRRGPRDPLLGGGALRLPLAVGGLGAAGSVGTQLGAQAGSRLGGGLGFGAYEDDVRTGGLLGGALTGPASVTSRSEPGKHFGRDRLDFMAANSESTFDQKSASDLAGIDIQKIMVNLLSAGNRLDLKNILSQETDVEIND